MSEELDEIEFFSCHICGKHHLISEGKAVKFRDFLFRKVICLKCFDTIVKKTEDSKPVGSKPNGLEGY